jgi:hypothetical protein
MSKASEANQIDPEKLEAFIGKVVTDFGAALSSSLAYIGQKLGLYKALAEGGAQTPAELAARTETTERYVREWLINQASSGYIEYDASTGRFRLSPEQAVALTDEDSPFFVGGGFYVVKAMSRATPRIAEAFKNGGGLLWGDNDPDLFIGTERFFRPGYQMHLVNEWIPALTGIEEKLKAGGAVADIGCGHGASTIIMALAYRTRASTASIITRLRLNTRAARLKKLASPTALTSRWSPRVRFPKGLMIWRASSIASTTWATPSAPHGAPAKS